MKLYSDFPARRSRQILADATALALIGLWVWFGATVFTIVASLAGFGRQMEDAGVGFRDAMRDVGETLGGIPLIGSGIRIPFDGASGAGAALEAAGQSQQDAIAQLALLLGVGMPVLPILGILAIWLIPRIRFIRRASHARSVARGPAGLDLLALRALATGRLGAIAAIDHDALGAWRRGDPRVVRELAQLELRSAGVRVRGQSETD